MLIEPAAYIPLSDWFPKEAFVLGEIEGKNAYVFKANDNFTLRIQYDGEAFSDFIGDTLICDVPVTYRFENQILAGIILYYNGFSVELSFNSDRPTVSSSFLTSAEQEVQRLKGIIDTHLKPYA